MHYIITLYTAVGSGNSTPTRSRSHTGNVRTPAGRFLPPDMSTPIQGDAAGVVATPQTPVEIRKFLGTNNSGAGRLVDELDLTFMKWGC